MGGSYSTRTLFFADEMPDGEPFVRRTVERLRENGLDTDTALDDAAADIATGNGGSIEVRLDDYPIEVRFDFEASAEAPDTVLWLDGPDESAFEEYDVPLDTARDRADRLADAIADLAVEIDPWLAVGWIPYPHQDVHPYPEGYPPKTRLERLGWVTVFGEPFHEQFGGRERLLEAPARNVCDLENGAVLVRESTIPGTDRSDTDSGPAPSTDDYLFGGESLAELRAEIERQRRTYVDPFRDLEEGELASDIVMCEDHAPFEFEGMDDPSFPDDLDRGDRCHVLCVRRDGDTLWEGNNGEFVRRLVDVDGRPIGEMPDGVPDHREMISLVISTEYDGASSLDLYRMDSPEDPSVVGGLLGLERASDGESIWQDRNEPVTRD
ncbi:hypothetical protein [Natrinema versiforme]|uniref:Uncharacterized protein n=1 Tax=Natrinema versiforme TaxID=88724 RepID=A0A4V1FZT9_9EURY|nr:hypothetical protein [Natrinema versiforme]QCS43006.1 hypothetical protein FEJ81_11785 [Natrinema versiforme]